MALTTVSSNLVWQEAKIQLSMQHTSSRFGIAQVHLNIFAVLKAHLSQTKGNPNLFLAPFAAADIDDTSGYAAINAACTIYGFFGRKTVTNSTDTYVYLVDDDTDDSGVEISASTTTRAVIGFLTAQDEVSMVWSQGLPMATGLVIKAYTLGSTSTTPNDAAAADTPNGFLIVGDPL